MNNLKNFDVIICAAQKDCDNLNDTIKYIRKNSNCKNVKVISNAPLENIDEEFEYINENNIMNELSYKSIENYFIKRNVKPSRVGWYLQQFIKMAYAYICEDDNYLVWDADTLMLNPIEFFDKDGKICFDNSRIWKDDVFNKTVLEVLKYPKEKSETYITEHMMIDSACMKELILKIANGEKLEDFWKIILDKINDDDLIYGGFSEFEVIGTFMDKEFSDKVTSRPLRSNRNIANKIGTTLNKYDIYSFSKKYDFVSLEKNHKINSCKFKIIFNKIKNMLTYKFQKNFVIL